MIYDCTSLKCLPIFQSFVKTAKHIHLTELGTMVCVDFFKYNSLKILPCVYFIRLGGWQRCVESEKGAMKQKSWRNTVLETLQNNEVWMSFSGGEYEWQPLMSNRRQSSVTSAPNKPDRSIAVSWDGFYSSAAVIHMLQWRVGDLGWVHGSEEVGSFASIP